MKQLFLILTVFLLWSTSALAQPRLKSGDRIVTLGDSITEDSGYQAFMKRVFDRFYPDLRIEIINAGISGHKAPGMSARLKRDVIDKNPTVVTISCGVNDVWHGCGQHNHRKCHHCSIRREHLTLHFTTTQYTQESPTLWLQVDDGEWQVVRPAEALAVSKVTLASGSHIARVVVKGFREWGNRWESPLVGSVVFRGVTPDAATQFI